MKIEVGDSRCSVRIDLLDMMKAYLGHVYLTAPNVRPRTRCFCKTSVKIMIGAIAIVATAIYSPQASPMLPENPDRYTGTVAASLGVRIDTKRNSFQEKIAERIVVAASPGRTNGKATRVTICQRV
jgi:hypothetical protein